MGGKAASQSGSHGLAGAGHSAASEAHQGRPYIAEDFDWENAIVRVDDRNVYQEARLVAVGPIGARLYVMVFCLRETDVRIISLRKANRREIKQYEKA